jgi:hypothetical protein
MERLLALGDGLVAIILPLFNILVELVKKAVEDASRRSNLGRVTAFFLNLYRSIVHT